MARFCEYCGLDKKHMSEGKSYFDYGHKVKNYWICEDCDKDHDNKIKTIITTDLHEFQGYEGLLRIIKELSVLSDGTTEYTNFYEAAREAYKKSNSFHEYINSYSNSEVDVTQIDKNYTPLWEFTYRLANGSEPRITINLHHDGDYDVCWVPGADEEMKFNPAFVKAFEENERKP